MFIYFSAGLLFKLLSFYHTGNRDSPLKYSVLTERTIHLWIIEVTKQVTITYKK